MLTTRMNKRGLLPFLFIIGLALALVIGVVGIVGGFAFIFSQNSLFYFIGAGGITLTFIYLLKTAFASPKDIQPRKLGLAIFLIFFFALFIFLPAFHLLPTQMTAFTGTENKNYRCSSLDPTKVFYDEYLNGVYVKSISATCNKNLFGTQFICQNGDCVSPTSGTTENKNYRCSSLDPTKIYHDVYVDGAFKNSVSETCRKNVFGTQFVCKNAECVAPEGGVTTGLGGSSGNIENTNYRCSSLDPTKVFHDEYQDGKLIRSVSETCNKNVFGVQFICKDAKCSAPETGVLPSSDKTNTVEEKNECNAKAEKYPYLGYTWVEQTTPSSIVNKVTYVASFTLLGRWSPTVKTSCEPRFVGYYTLIIITIAVLVFVLILFKATGKSKKRKR